MAQEQDQLKTSTVTIQTNEAEIKVPTLKDGPDFNEPAPESNDVPEPSDAPDAPDGENGGDGAEEENNVVQEDTGVGMGQAPKKKKSKNKKKKNKSVCFTSNLRQWNCC